MVRISGLAVAAPLVVKLAACGGGDDGDDDDMGGTPDSGGGGGACTSGATASVISSNHGHGVTIPQADLDAGTQQTYSIMGGSDHDHMITLTAGQMATLLSGTPVMVVSTSGGAHTHNVTLTCV